MVILSLKIKKERVEKNIKSKIENKMMATKAKTLLILLALLFIMPTAYASINNASIINSSSKLPMNMSYEESTIKAYIDNAAGNPDITLRVCSSSDNLTGKYGGFVYKVGDRPEFRRVAGMPTTELGMFSDAGGGCYDADNNLNFISDFAVYPAYVYAVISDDESIDTSDTFVLINLSSWLVGRYAFNNYGYGNMAGVQRSYNPSNGNISVSVTGIQGYHNGYKEIWPGGTQVNKQLLVIAVCNLSSSLEGYSCNSANVTSPSVTNTLYTDVTNPPETDINIRYLVVNGIPHSFCIGPDLSIGNITITPSTVYQSQIVTLNATVQNVNNVNITSNFNVSFWKGSEFIANVTISGLNVGETKYATYDYDTTGFQSGIYNITARVEDANLGDCDNTNDNSTTTLEILKTYNLSVYINETKTNIFPRPGRPYNITIFVTDSDGNNAPQNLILKITEKNGLNLFAPTQGYEEDSEKKGVVSYSIAEVKTNSSGATSFALMPMGNKLYLPEYANENVTDYVGNYSLYIELFNGTEELQLYNESSDTLIDQYMLTLENHTVLDPTISEENSIYVFNHNKWVTTIINFMIQVFGNIQKWTAP